MLIHQQAIILLFSFLLVQSVLSSDPPESSPSPSPGQSTGLLSPPTPEAGAPFSPSPSPQLDSPPAPPPSTPGSSPAPAPAPVPSSSNSSSPGASPAPVPSPDGESDVNHESADSVSKDEKDSPGGMSGGQKAGVAFGVIAGACIVIFGGVLYKKRQDNVRRSQYGYGARREML